MQSLVSIIIPHYNRAELLKETIASVQMQTYPGWEIIIVDDQSDESAWKEIQTFASKNITVLQRLERQKGPSACRNIGVENAKGEYLIFLDSDDLLAPFCLEQRVEIMVKSSMDMGIFKIREFYKTPGDSTNSFNLEIDKKSWTQSFLKNENPWQTMGPIWKKEFFGSVGGFDEDLVFMEDPELHLRAINEPNARIEQFYSLPGDCFYRINFFDDTKKDFYYNSILYRILFYKKIIQEYDKEFLNGNAAYIKAGIYHSAKTFLYSRKNQFPKLFDDLKILMGESKMFSTFEICKFSFLMNCGNSKNLIARRLKLKGICYRLLP